VRAAVNVAPTRPQRTWDIFLSASSSDRAQADRLYYLLAASYKVFHAPQELAPGELWQQAIDDAIDHSRSMLVLFSSESVLLESTSVSAEIRAARRRLDRDPSFRLIPVQLDPDARPDDEFLNRYQWLQARGDLQSVAAHVRRSLGDSAGEESDRERNARLRAELDQAIAEKARLMARVEQVQQEVLEQQRRAQELESGRAALIERAENLARHFEHEREERMHLAKRAERMRAFSVAAILAILVMSMALSYLVLFVYRMVPVPPFLRPP
jgi:hypothetical protein